MRGSVWVANEGDVRLFDALTLQPAGTVDLGGHPHGMRPGPSGALVVANTGAGTVDVVSSGAGPRLVRSIPVPGTPIQVAVTPDGRSAFASLADTSRVVKVDLRAGAVVAAATVPHAPAQVHLTPDGRTLLSADQGSTDRPGRTVTFLDAADLRVLASVPTGSGPHGITIDRAGRWAWVTNTYGDSVSVLDLRTREVVRTVRVGQAPNGVSWSPRPVRASDRTPAPLWDPSRNDDSHGHSDGDDHAH